MDFRKELNFQGGRSYIVNFHKPLNEQEVKDALNVQWGKYPEVKTYGSNQQFEITTDYLVNREGSAADSTVAIKCMRAFRNFFQPEPCTGIYADK